MDIVSYYAWQDELNDFILGRYPEIADEAAAVEEFVDLEEFLDTRYPEVLREFGELACAPGVGE